jgi:hypothetical protein
MEPEHNSPKYFDGWHLVRILVLLPIVILFANGNKTLAIQCVGVVTLGQALWFIWHGRVPYSWQGQASGYLTGVWVYIFAIPSGTISISMLMAHAFFLDLLGW